MSEGHLFTCLLSKQASTSPIQQLASSTRLVNVNIGSIETAKLDIELKYLNLMSQIYTTNIISERLFERRSNVSITRMISKILELLFEYKHPLQKRKTILHNVSC